MQAANVHVVPYTNGRIFDPHNPKYHRDNAKQFACHQPLSDKPFGEKYSDMAYPFILMDPGTRYWQATIAAAVGGVQKAGNTSGVYLDQTASYYAEPCYGKEPLRTGGGARWADGNRATLEAATRAVGPGNVVVSESNAEAYLGSLHGYLAVYGWKSCGVVPAFQAVYGGWSVNVGGAQWPSGLDYNGVRMYLAQQWTFGHVMGWAEPATFLSNSSTTGFARELAQLKLAQSQYLVFGRLMHPPIINAVDGGPLNTTRVRTRSHTTPSCKPYIYKMGPILAVKHCIYIIYIRIDVSYREGATCMYIYLYVYVYVYIYMFIVIGQRLRYM